MIDPSQYTFGPTQINDSHKHYDVAIAIIVMLVLATAVTLVRLWYQWRARVFGMEDWAMIPALLLYIGHSVMGVYCNLNGGIGKPLWEVTYPEFQIWYKGLAGTAFLYPAMTSSVRISILLFYYRIFSKTHKTTRRAIHVLFVLTAMFVIVYSVMPGFICRPLPVVWMLLERTAEKCQTGAWFYKFTLSTYAISGGFDVILVLLPIYPVSQLQMNKKAKMGALAMFALGASSCIAAFYKLGVYCQQWGRIGDIDPRWSSNFFSLLIPPQFDQYGYTFWIPSQVEPTTALIGASLPSLRRGLRPSIQKIKSSVQSLMTGVSSSTESKWSAVSSRKMKIEREHDGDQSPFVKMHERTTHSAHSVTETDFELQHVGRTVQNTSKTGSHARSYDGEVRLQNDAVWLK